MYDRDYSVWAEFMIVFYFESKTEVIANPKKNKIIEHYAVVPPVTNAVAVL